MFFLLEFILRRLGGFFPPKKQTQTPKKLVRLCFFFSGNWKRDLALVGSSFDGSACFGYVFFFQPTTHRDCGSIRWMKCVRFFPEGQGFGEEVFFHLGCPGSFQGIPRTPEALNEPLMSPLPRAVLRGAPWLEPFTRGLGPNKYPCDIYKVYMGLIIEGTIPRIYIYIFFFLDVFITIKEFSRRSLAEIFFLDYCKSLVVQLHGRVWQLVLER